METKRSQAYRTFLLVHVLLLDALLFFVTLQLSTTALFGGFSPTPYLVVGALAAAGLLTALFRSLYFLPAAAMLAVLVDYFLENPFQLQGWRFQEMPMFLVLDFLVLTVFTVLVFIEERRALMEA